MQTAQRGSPCGLRIKVQLARAARASARSRSRNKIYDKEKQNREKKETTCKFWSCETVPGLGALVRSN